MGNRSREIETIIKNEREDLRIKNTVREMKNAFDWFFKRLYTEKRVSDSRNV